MSNRDRADLRDGQRDAAVERAWRKGSTEQPSARLDAAILAAAREAVTSPGEAQGATSVRMPPGRRWSQWAPMAAAAAVAALALTLVQTLPRDPPVAPAPAAHETATTVAPTGVPPPARVPPGATEPQQIETPLASDSASPVARERPASPPMTEASPAVAPPSVASVAERDAAVPPAGSNELPSASKSARSMAVESALAGQAAGVDQWVQRIQSLHAAGELAAATDALRAFRAADPDADRHLPEQLREWAGSVR